ncbi:MAG: cupin domain-containing protein [Ilumatobacteraceae bacterium]
MQQSHFVNLADLPVETRAVDGNTVVNWWTLLGRNTDAGLVMGIAEIPVDAHRPSRGHLHPQAETYVILSGVAEMHINDEPPRLMHANEVVHIPGGTEHISLNGSSTEPLRLLYIFPGINSFDEVEYEFPPGA